MEYPKNNYAYIDGANLHKGVNELGWRLDYIRLRIWLTEKYNIFRAYIFLGFIVDNQDLYNYLHRAGFILIFRQITYETNGKPKGNCDSELVLKVVVYFYEKKFKKAVVISGDGDFACLALFLLNKKVLKTIIAPSNRNCSFLIRRIQGPLVFLNEFKDRLAEKEKAPDADRTA